MEDPTCPHSCNHIFFSCKRSVKCGFAQRAMTITPNCTLNETSLHITEQDTHSHQTRDCLQKTHQGSWKQRLLGQWWSWYRVSILGYVRMELICRVSNTLPLFIIKDLSDRTLRWPSNLAISIVHQKNHQQLLGTTNRRVNVHQHPRYFQDKQQSWMKILPLAHDQTETQWAKNMHAYNIQLSWPSNHEGRQFL
jgi:hypothetical protein